MESVESNSTRTVVDRVLVNLDRCVECGSCASACYFSHGNMPAVNFARSGPALLPLICRQCKDAPCVEVCPAEAMVCDDNGVVRRRLFRCVGCGSCARACPFGVLSNELGGVPAGIRNTECMTGHQIAKCDLCEDRTADGGIPRCVAACPAGALRFADEHQGTEAGLTVLGGRSTGEDPYKRR